MVSFNSLIKSIFPRLMTQVCRDINSPSYGCFDRNWWHYKIRDFSSIILQQGGYFVYQTAKIKEFRNIKNELIDIAKASILFWTKRSHMRGAFEEYYPWENGYPPLAFSTLAMVKMIDELDYDNIETELAIKKASDKLLNRFENQATNQQLAGLSALSVIKKIRPKYVSDDKFETLVQKTLALQDKEGWFMEYDGPDLGYLSVSMDCLWDLYDYTHDERFIISCRSAFSYLSALVLHQGSNIGMHNSRNTDYIVPYGIVRFLDYDQYKSIAEKVLNVLFHNIDDNNHFFNSVDDRYWSHYIGHSIVRAQLFFQAINEKDFLENNMRFAYSSVITNKDLLNSGYILREINNFNVIVSCKKGGIISARDSNNRYFSDYGWLIKRGRKQYVMHWWNPYLKFNINSDNISITGEMFSHSEKTSTPFKHLLLRILSFFIGHKIINLLKNHLIFKNSNKLYSFERVISFRNDCIEINDKIFGLKGNELISQAPRASKRHVASADSYNIEDIKLKMNIEYFEKIVKDRRSFNAKKIYIL